MTWLFLYVPAMSGCLVFACFVWAVRGHFVSSSMPALMKLVSVLALASLVTGLVAIFRHQPGAGQVAVSLIGMILSLWLFLAALAATRGRGLRLAFDPSAPPGIVTSGPYAKVRHPIYLAYGIFWCAWLIIAPLWYVAAPVALLLALYVIAARREEALILRSEHSTAYQAYQRRTGLLLPWAGAAK